MRRRFQLPGWEWAVLLLLVPQWSARAAGLGDSASLATSDVRIELNAGGRAPRLERLVSSVGSAWNNTENETLPASVEMNRVQIPLDWRLNSALSVADSHSVVYVYECDKPHLRLRWEWKVRAAFGPVEHRISIENLNGQEIWLPMVNSLELDWQVRAAKELRNLYVEKGADTPSAQGTHLDVLNDGYKWTGKSSTYARPVAGEAREIIPAEFVYTTGQPESGGMRESSSAAGRASSWSAIGEELKTVLGLDPEPGPFRTAHRGGRKLRDADGVSRRFFRWTGRRRKSTAAVGARGARQSADMERSAISVDGQ